MEPPQLITPLRFGTVQPNLYRGSYPRSHNSQFLKSLGLKTIVSITPKPLSEDDFITQFANEQNIQLIHVESAASSSKSKKKRGVPVEYGTVRKVVEYMINSEYSPMYVHCLNGSQVTCLLVASLRKLSFWSMASIGEEFVRYADFDLADRLFIENFRAEIEVPDYPVFWMWKGLSKTGVVRNHPTLKIHDKENREKEQVCEGEEENPENSGE